MNLINIIIFILNILFFVADLIVLKNYYSLKKEVFEQLKTSYDKDTAKLFKEFYDL